MFENVLGQPAVELVTADLAANRLAPSMLFWGPSSSGKGTAALELVRVLSCEAPERGAWNCECRSCGRHRQLVHGDLLMLGSRPFQAEIAAAGAALLREPSGKPAQMLFIRSVRKLMARFSPILWEDDAKIAKLNPLLLSLEEALEDIGAGHDGETLAKLCASITTDARKLEAEGISATIPIAPLRRAAYWSRLAPQGRHKCIVIENADRMQEGARNSLLKILEEPPETLSLILTSANRDAILPTLLSRLRPYRFLQRDAATEADVLRRIFRTAETGEGEGKGLINRYLDSFLPLSDEGLYPLAAFFIASAARGAAVKLKRQNRELGAALLSLGKFCAAAAQAGGLEPVADNGSIVKAVLAGAENFESPGLFSRFLAAVLTTVSRCFREERNIPAPWLELWRKEATEADTAVKVWNIGAALVLERLCTALKQSMAGLP